MDMRLCRIILVVLISFFFISSNAQVFVGGNIGFNASVDKTDAGTAAEQKLFDYTLNFSPYAGKFLSEKFALGLALNVSNSRNQTDANPETFSKATAFGIAPFFRYYALKWNKFSVFGQGQVGLYYGISKDKTGGITIDGPKTFSTNIEFFPGLSYDLNDKLSLLTSLNFFSLGVNHDITTSGNNKHIETAFNLGAGLNNIITPGSVTIGAIYKF